MITKPFVQDGRFHQDCIRVLWSGMTERLNRNSVENTLKIQTPTGPQIIRVLSCEQIWGSLPTLLMTFQKIEGLVGGFANADLITSTIKDLAKL